MIYLPINFKMDFAGDGKEKIKQNNEQIAPKYVQCIHDNVNINRKRILVTLL